MDVRRPSAHAIEHYRSALLLSLPALVGLAIFWYWPTIQAVILGFQDYNLMSGSQAWTGLENYRTAATDPLLGLTFLNTVIYFLMEVPLQMALALALALLVRRGPAWLRTVILVPTVTSMVVVSVIWGLMYHPQQRVDQQPAGRCRCAASAVPHQLATGHAVDCAAHDLEERRLQHAVLPGRLGEHPAELL